MKVNILFKRVIVFSFILSLFFACKTLRSTKEERGTARAERSIKRIERKKKRAYKRYQKKAYRKYWKSQSKQVKKSIKKNKKRLKKKYS